ncbi:MAG: hypothetical protein AAF914_04890 [Pseudomonadota bacterium]
MKRFAIAAGLVAAMAAPAALADGHAREVAIMIFNSTEDNPTELTAMTSEPMFVDVTQESTLAEILDQINMTAAMSDDQIGNMFLTIVGNTNAAQEIFDTLIEQDEEGGE